MARDARLLRHRLATWRARVDHGARARAVRSLLLVVFSLSRVSLSLDAYDAFSTGALCFPLCRLFLHLSASLSRRLTFPLRLSLVVQYHLHQPSAVLLLVGNKTDLNLVKQCFQTVL